jgi:hypothetical protein
MNAFLIYLSEPIVSRDSALRNIRRDLSSIGTLSAADRHIYTLKTPHSGHHVQLTLSSHVEEGENFIVSQVSAVGYSGSNDLGKAMRLLRRETAPVSMNASHAGKPTARTSEPEQL